MMVKPDSSDPGLAGARPIPIDGNHWTLCKPKDRTSQTYIEVADFIERRFERPKAPGEEKLDALSEGQRVLMERNASMMAMLQRDKGIPRAALVGHLVRLGARDDIVDEEIPKFLDRFANEFSAIRGQLQRIANDNPEASAVRKQAAELLDAREPRRRQSAARDGAGADQRVAAGAFAKRRRSSATKPGSNGSN